MAVKLGPTNPNATPQERLLENVRDEGIINEGIAQASRQMARDTRGQESLQAQLDAEKHQAIADDRFLEHKNYYVNSAYKENDQRKRGQKFFDMTNPVKHPIEVEQVGQLNPNYGR
jgi:hypothetical protein